MKYWLLKTEPEEWSWKDQIKAGSKGAEWNGVRNFQASKNLKNMKIGDKCFFYHTGKEKRIVGIVKIIKEHFLDKMDKTHKFVSVAAKASTPFKRAIKLEEIKTLIKEAIPDADISIQDLAGDENHYSATIKSRIFSGKSKIEQHKIVYKALRGKMGNELHALALNTIER